MKNFTTPLIGFIIAILLGFAGWVVASNGKINDKIDTANKSLTNYNGRISVVETKEDAYDRNLTEINKKLDKLDAMNDKVNVMSGILDKYK